MSDWKFFIKIVKLPSENLKLFHFTTKSWELKQFKLKIYKIFLPLNLFRLSIWIQNYLTSILKPICSICVAINVRCEIRSTNSLNCAIIQRFSRIIFLITKQCAISEKHFAKHDSSAERILSPFFVCHSSLGYQSSRSAHLAFIASWRRSVSMQVKRCLNLLCYFFARGGKFERFLKF